MNPYRQSGSRAEQNLAVRAHAARAAARRRVQESLREFKWVINGLGATAIVLTPLVGVLMESAGGALLTAALFFAFMWVLEAFECRRKRECEALR